MLKFTSIVIYRFICFLVTFKKDQVVFMTPRHSELKDNLRYLYEEMAVEKPDLDYVILTTENRKLVKPIRQVIKEYYYLATSKLFILDDYYLPLYLIRVRKETKVVQLWHASGPLKRVGYSLRGHPDGPNESYVNIVPIHSNYDVVVVNSDAEIDYYAEAFGMDEKKIHAIGSPRTDILFANQHNKMKKQQFLTKHPQFKNKELILYAPTFRGKSTDPTPYVPQLDLLKLVPHLQANNIALLLNLHPYMNENEEYMKNIDENTVFWNRNEYNIEELLMISDALISDYSSVIYDFAILEKPIALYCYDYEKYNKQRGFYVDIKQLLPATYFEKESDLVNWIVSEAKNTTEVKQLKEKNFKYQDGQASKRIIKLVSE